MIDSDFENIVDLLEKREDLKGTLWRYQIATFAEHVSQGRWTAYPWLKYLLTEIQVAVTQPGARIVVTAPPRHGKSEALSHYLPLWYLDWNTDKRVILASYSDALAVQFSLKVRQDFQIHADKLKAKVSAERYLVDDWHTTDHGGMRATGIGGSLTGMGGHLCFPGDTLILTERGSINIEHLLSLEKHPRVLSYDHDCDRLVWKRITGVTRRMVNEGLVEIETSAGNKIRATHEHPFYVGERIYRKAGHLQRGERLYRCSAEVAQEQGVCDMWRTQDNAREKSSSLLLQSQTHRINFVLRFLRERIFKIALRGGEVFRKRTFRFLLFSRMQQETSRNQEHSQSSLSCLRREKKKGSAVLFLSMCENWREVSREVASKAMRLLRTSFYSCFESFCFLFEGLQKQSSFLSHAWEGEFSVQERAELREVVPRHAKIYFGERSKHMPDLRRRESTERNKKQKTEVHVGTSGASHRQRSFEQSPREFNNSVQSMSCDTPSLAEISIRSIKTLRAKEQYVYDLEVEDCHNFFAEGILVHNCIVDDPHKDWSEANSPTIRKKVVDWFNSVLSLRAEPGASIVVVQTRWHEDDLAGYLLREHKDRWREIRLPALSEGDGDLLARPEGQALCPERYDELQLDKIKQSIGSFMFAGLYQQRPAPLEGGMVKRDSFRRWSTLPERFSTVIQSWDLTFKATGSSYIVGQVWGAAPHSNGTVYKSHYYLIDQIREKLSFMDTIKRIYELSERHESAVVKLIEDKANGPAIMSALKDQVPGIVAYSPRGSKEARLAAVSGLIEAGNVFIPEKSIASWSDDFVEEVATFPHGRNDDQVDAMTMAIDHLIHKRAEYRTDFSISEAGFRANPWRM